MHAGTRILAITLFLVVVCGYTDIIAQQAADRCGKIQYPVSTGPVARFRLDHIEGQAVFSRVSETREAGGVSGLCLALFNRGDKRPVAVATTDARSQFAFANVAPGRYTLVAYMSDLRQVIIDVQVDNRAARRRETHGNLLLHMRLQEDRRKSFASLVTNPELRQEILKMLEEDQGIRNDLIKEGVERSDKAMEARMASIDSKNTARMAEIIRTYGWPGPGLVGVDGTEAAFLLVQHADYRFQKKMLPVIRKAYLAGELSGQDYALLLDRVLVREGKPQVYGTAAKPFDQWKGGEPEMERIEDEANVDKRRAAVGLSSLAEYRELLKRMYLPKTQDKK